MLEFGLTRKEEITPEREVFPHKIKALETGLLIQLFRKVLVLFEYCKKRNNKKETL